MRRTLLLLLVLACFGCGSGIPKPQKVTGTPTPNPTLSEILTKIADSGELGGESLILEEVEKLRASDPKKATDLEKDFHVLSGLDEPNQVKQQAKRMLAKFK